VTSQSNPVINNGQEGAPSGLKPAVFLFVVAVSVLTFLFGTGVIQAEFLKPSIEKALFFEIAALIFSLITLISLYKGYKKNLSQYSLLLILAVLAFAVITSSNVLVLSNTLNEPSNYYNSLSLLVWSKFSAGVFSGLAILLLFNLFERQENYRVSRYVSNTSLFVGSSILLALLMIFLHTVGLPPVSVKIGPVTQPQFLLVALILGLALYKLSSSDYMAGDNFGSWLKIILLLVFLSTFLISPFSSVALEQGDTIEYLIKTIALACLAWGSFLHFDRSVLTREQKSHSIVQPLHSEFSVHKSISGRLLIMTSLLVILTTVTISSVLYVRYYTSIEDEEKNNLRLMSSFASSQVEQRVDDFYADTLFLGISRDLKEYANTGTDASKDKLHEMLVHFLQAKLLYSHVRVIDLQSGYARLDISTDNLAMSKSLIEDESYHESNFFESAADHDFDEVWLSDFDFQYRDGVLVQPIRPMLHAMYQVEGSDSNLLLVVDLPIADLFSSLAMNSLQLSTNDQKNLMVIDRQSQYLVHPVEGYQFATVSGTGKYVQDEFNVSSDWFKTLGATGIQLLKTRKIEDRSSVAVTMQGEEYDHVMGYSRLVITGTDNELVIAFIVPAQSILTVASQGAGQTLVTAIIVLIFALVVAWLASLSIAAPIRAISDALQTYKPDELSEHLPVDAKDEVGGLAQSINSLAESVVSNTEMLESEIEARNEASMLLQQAVIDAEAALSTKSQFLATMSHEIRTPMNGVLGMAQILAKTELTDRQRDHVNAITNSGEALLDIINDILDFSKIEAGMIEMDHAAFDMEKLLLNVVELLANRAHGKGIELLIDYPIDMPKDFMGDSGKLRQVILNLVGNAIKFTSEGYVLVKFRCEASEQSDEKRSLYDVSVSVIDTGLGISEEQQKKLFQAFTQADSSTTRKFGGTGLGLTISKNLIERMKGSIEVTSEMDKGSEFLCTMQLELNKSNRADVYQHYSSLRNTHFVLVDANEESALISKRLLEPANVNLSITHSAVDCQALVNDLVKDNRLPEAILINHPLGGSSALHLVESLKRNRRTQLIPILIMADAHHEDSNSFAKLGIDALIDKPYACGKLMDTLNRIFVSRIDGKYFEHDPEASQLIDDDEVVLNGTILLVEDTEINQMVAITILERLGLTVELAVNGQVAIDKLAEGQYDVVLMDCLMPVMDGFEATRAIRSNEQDSDAHQVVVALTANAMSETRKECELAGMDDFLTKPFVEQDLIDMLLKWLPAHQPQTEESMIEESQADNQTLPEDSDTADKESTGEGVTSVDQEVASIDKGVARFTESKHSEEEVFNKAKIAELEMLIKKEKVKNIVEHFRQEAPQMVEEMRSFSEGPQFNDMKRVAHSLKSTSDSLGIYIVRTISSELEQKWSNEQIEGLESDLMTLTQAIDEADGYLAKYIAS
jgi:signal transduction histidine kinase/CheY-like chemotaxis protein/HPt (histidine-containing phosphotransfer) domain-containing protein